MRISDWSSDVCSSDLCVDQRPTSGKGRGLFRWASTLRRGVAKFDRQIVGQEQAPAPALRDLNQQFGCDCAFEQLARARDTKPKVIGDRLRREQRLMDGRSEEHTYELQSLMRSS